MARRTSHTPPRKPRQDRSQATVAAIVDAAVQILIEKGTTHVTVEAITTRAGVSQGSFYQYFASKGALIDACIDRELSRSLKQLEDKAPFLLGLPLREAIASVIDAVVANYLADEVFLRVVIAERTRHPAVRELQDRLVSLIRAYLQGQLKDDDADPELAAFVLVHGLQAVVEAALEKRPHDLRRNAIGAQLKKLALGYLAPP